MRGVIQYSMALLAMLHKALVPMEDGRTHFPRFTPIQRELLFKHSI